MKPILKAPQPKRVLPEQPPVLTVTNPSNLPPDAIKAMLPLTKAMRKLFAHYITNTIRHTAGDTRKNGESILRILNAADKNARN